MQNSASLLTRIRHDRTEPLKPGFDADGGERYQMALARLEQQVSAVQLEESAILKDRLLTDEGQRKKLTALAGGIVVSFDWLGQMLSQADAAASRLSHVLFSPIMATPKGDAVVQYLRDQEIRHSLGAASVSEWNAAYLLALERGDLETARALETAPGPARVSPDMRRRGEEAYGRRTNPAAWEQLQAVEHLTEHLSSLAGQTAQWLVGLGASPESVQGLTPKV